MGNAAYRLHGRLEKDGDHARQTTVRASTSLGADFALSCGLDEVVSKWVDQLRTLLDACAHISNHLDYTKKAHAGDEERLATVFSKISELDRGFDESTQPQPQPQPQRGQKQSEKGRG